MASYPSGKGAVCKTVMQQFDSARRLANIESLLQATHFFCLPNLSSKAGIRFYIWGEDSSKKSFIALWDCPVGQSFFSE